jgi:hypothetical protein
MRKSLLAVSAIAVFAAAADPRAAACTPTGFVRDGINLTAALINPASVTGVVHAYGCHIGVYYAPGSHGTVANADIAGANYYGIVVDGSSGETRVDVLDTTIHDIGETPLNGSQHGVGIYYAAFNAGGTATGKVRGNSLYNYQKGGIVVNGVGADVQVQDNDVLGQGPVSYIAQNGIQFGYGAQGSAMRNTVTGHSYMGTSTVSGGIIVVGGPGYGAFPFTTDVQIVQNTVADNDIGIWLSNLEADFSAPAQQTNIKVVNNQISNAGLTNNYGGFGYQAGIADQGNNDKLINNRISGPGYDAAANPSAYVVEIDADASFTNRPKVHANR